MPDIDSLTIPEQVGMARHVAEDIHSLAVTLTDVCARLSLTESSRGEQESLCECILPTLDEIYMADKCFDMATLDTESPAQGCE